MDAIFQLTRTTLAESYFAQLRLQDSELKNENSPLRP